jgi:uncharacterized protein
MSTTSHDPDAARTQSPVLPVDLTRARYASLTTFRRDGTGVDCPVWFAWSDDGSTIWFRSKADTAKIRRLLADPTVDLRACSWRGVVRPGAVVVRGRAEVLAESDADPNAEPVEAILAERTLSHRYGWQWYTTPLFRIPFTHTSKVDLTLRQKLGLIRARQSHGGSALVGVRIDRA